MAARERPARPDRAAARPAGGATRRAAPTSPKLLEAGDRLERDALAGVSPTRARADARGAQAGALRRRAAPARAAACSIGREEADAELTPLLAELDARAEAEGIDEQTAEQLLLRLRERKLQRELAEAEEARLPDLQQALARVRDRIREFA